VARARARARVCVNVLSQGSAVARERSEMCGALSWAHFRVGHNSDHFSDTGGKQ
jgi:hypothetical protein